MITYKVNEALNQDEVAQLYNNAGWISYTKDMPRLMNAIEHSLHVITAWDDHQLVGIIRCVGDGLTILYIQDIIVHSNVKRQGIGRTLVGKVLDTFSDVRQNVLITDDSNESNAFYQALGFQTIQTFKGMCYVIYR